MHSSPDFEQLAKLLRAGDFAQVEHRLRDLVNRHDSPPESMEMLAEALRRQGRVQEALGVCDNLIVRFPHRPGTWREAGRTLNNLGQLVRAAQMLQKAQELDPADADTCHDLGHVLARLHDIAGARAAFSMASQLRPGWAVPLARLGLLEIDAADFAAAEVSLQKAVDLDRRDPKTWTALGVARHRRGKLALAGAAYREAVHLKPHDADAWSNLGISLHDEGKLEEAIDAYRQALAAQPGNHRAGVHLADAQLEAGRCQAALGVADKVLAAFPGHSGALASRAVALHRLGRTDEYLALVDLSGLILAIDIETPAGFSDLAQFNQALAKHVRTHPTLRYEPQGHATRHGHHTADLLRFDKGPVAALERAIEQAVAAYRHRLAAMPAHPVSRSSPRQWTLSLWSVLMGSRGHQLPHIHPTAWLSGVYYAAIPAVIRDDDATQSGWIEFGPPPEKLGGDSEFPAQRFAPRMGRMFLFPAFLYHQTIPFFSSEPRISLAFDVAPAS